MNWRASSAKILVFIGWNVPENVVSNVVMSQSMGSFFTVSLVFQPLWRVENVTPSPRNFCQLPTEMCLSYSDWWANPLAFCCCWQFYSFLAALRHLCVLLSFIQVVWDLPCRDCNTNRSLRITKVVEAEFCVEGVFNFAPSWYWLVFMMSDQISVRKAASEA